MFIFQSILLKAEELFPLTNLVGAEKIYKIKFL